MKPYRRFRGLIIATLLALSFTKAWAVDERVQLKTSTGTLHGTLDLPSSTAPYPVVLIIAGSGATDRDGNQTQLKNDSLKQLGQGLAAKGIAALRYDKRGVGESASAMATEAEMRFETYIADAGQWVDWLRQDPRFSRVSIAGHSEGSLIGMVAAKQTKADGYISIAGSGRTAQALLREQLRGKLPANLQTKNNEFLDKLSAGQTVTNVPTELMVLYRPSLQPYLISWFKYDPVREIAALEIPVLIIQGTTDLQVSVADAKRLAAAKKTAKLSLIDGMNHVLKQAKLPAEQQATYTNPALPIMAQVVKEIVAFLPSVK